MESIESSTFSEGAQEARATKNRKQDASNMSNVHLLISKRRRKEFTRRSKQFHISRPFVNIIGHLVLALIIIIPKLSSSVLCLEAGELGSFRVAALASKLDQWLTCRRMQGEQASLEAASSSNSVVGWTTSNQDIELVIGSQETTTSSNLSLIELQQANSDVRSRASGAGSAQAHCPAHFDGHLCWPATLAPTLIRLPCPRLLALPGNQKLSTSHLNNNSSIENAFGATVASLDDQASKLQHNNVKASSLTLAIAETRQQNQEQRWARRSCRIADEWNDEADYSDCFDPRSKLFDPTDQWLNLSSSDTDKRIFAMFVDQLERIEPAIDPYSDPDLLDQWMLCIGNMTQKLLNHGPDEIGEHNKLCPIIFDGWRCWPETRAGDTAYVGCPANLPGFIAERKAHKICTQNGTWYRHPQTNRYWSNYTTCVDTNDLAFRTKILNLYVIGNTISLVALSASLIIFMAFKSLRCTRVTIHKNLFLSFIINNLMWIVWYTLVVSDANLLQSNPIECRLWHIVLHYFLVSNYFWMFCEGLYLHTLLVVAFVSEDRILKYFYIIGWIIPIPIILAYAYNRSYDTYYTHFCWMEESPYTMILMTPIGFSLLLNLIFLINIVRVLVTKLRANNSPDAHQTRKAVRATLFLIPLLGLHYILTPFRPEAKSEWEFIYEFITALCTSFQGLCVAMLFCFCNGEVSSTIKRKIVDWWHVSHWQSRSRARTRTSMTPSTTLFVSLRNNTNTNTNSNSNTNNNGNNAFNNARLKFNKHNQSDLDHGTGKTSSRDFRSRSNTITFLP